MSNLNIILLSEIYRMRLGSLRTTDCLHFFFLLSAVVIIRVSKKQVMTAHRRDTKWYTLLLQRHHHNRCVTADSNKGTSIDLRPNAKPPELNKTKKRILCHTCALLRVRESVNFGTPSLAVNLSAFLAVYVRR